MQKQTKFIYFFQIKLHKKHHSNSKKIPILFPVKTQTNTITTRTIAMIKWNLTQAQVVGEMSKIIWDKNNA